MMDYGRRLAKVRKAYGYKLFFNWFFTTRLRKKPQLDCAHTF